MPLSSMSRMSSNRHQVPDAGGQMGFSARSFETISRAPVPCVNSSPRPARRRMLGAKGQASSFLLEIRRCGEPLGMIPQVCHATGHVRRMPSAGS